MMQNLVLVILILAVMAFVLNNIKEQEQYSDQAQVRRIAEQVKPIINQYISQRNGVNFSHKYTRAPFVAGNVDDSSLAWFKVFGSNKYWTGMGKPFWLCDSPPFNQVAKRTYEKIYNSGSQADIYCKFQFNTDNKGIVYLNNLEIGQNNKWEQTATAYGYLKYGNNRIQLEVTNLGGPGGGILSCSRNSDNAVLFVTDSSWKMSSDSDPGSDVTTSINGGGAAPAAAIDTVPGYSGASARFDPPNNANQSPEMCRKKALDSGGKYVAWGHRNSNHPQPGYRNTCFLYTAPLAPFTGNASDKAHTTGCLRPGEKVEWGCKPTNYFELSFNAANAAPWYIDSHNNVNISKKGRKLQLVIDTPNDIFNDANGPYVAIKDVVSGLYLRHAGLVLHLSQFVKSNYDFAFKFVDLGNNTYKIYNAYAGGYYIGVDRGGVYVAIQHTTLQNASLITMKVPTTS